MSGFQGIERAFAKLSFSSKQRLRIYNKIATMTAFGVPLQRTLDLLLNQASKGGKKKNDPLAIILSDWMTSIRNGRPLSAAVAKWVPYNERMMIEAGEESKNLSDAMKQLIMINESVSEMRKAIIGGLGYPIALLTAICLVLWLFGTKVIPAFASVLPTESWTGTAASMAIMSDWVINWMPISVAIVIAFFLSIFFTMNRWTGQLRVYFDQVPPWSIYRLVTGSGFLLSLGALVSSGIPAVQALRKIGRNASPWLQERVNKTLKHVYSGCNIGVALDKTKYKFPDQEIIYDLVAYADLPAFSEMLNKIGQEWIADSLAKIKTQTRILNTISVALMAGVVGWIFSGLFAIQQQVSQSVSGGGGGF